MITVDDKAGLITVLEKDGTQLIYPFASPEAFEIISHYWLRIGWDTKYVYTFSWLGRPIIQLPEDILRIQEIIYSIKPNIIIETGVAHGGSIVFYASLLRLLGIEGKVIGIDIEIRPHNRQALDTHELRSSFELIEGSSLDPKVINQVATLIPKDTKTLIILDSNHSREHVLNELIQYSQFVTPGSYIIATDGIMKDLNTAPRSKADWDLNNPYYAVQDFLKETDDFILEEPAWLFNESAGLSKNITYWPGAYLKRKS